MTTYRANPPDVPVIADNGNTGFGPGDPDPRCDACSTFDPDGFAHDGRSWTPRYGAPCQACGVPA